MAKMGKNLRKAYESFDPAKEYTIAEGVSILKKTHSTKFDETVEIAINLGVDPRHADQNVRGAVLLPNGLGKSVRVLAFCQGEDEAIAKAAGADYAGNEEFVTKIQKEGWMEFDAVVATPDMMRFVGRLGRVLGPRGLMPNPKTGTVTKDIGQAVKDMKAGKVQFRVDKKGAVLHAPVGKISFSEVKLVENIETLVDVINKLKPSTSKGAYMKRFTLTSTMGAGIRIDVSTFGK